MQLPKKLMDQMSRDQKNAVAIKYVKTMITYPFACIQAELDELTDWADAGIIHVEICLKREGGFTGFKEKNSTADFYFTKDMKNGYHRLMWHIRQIRGHLSGSGYLLFPLKDKTYWRIAYSG